MAKDELVRSSRSSYIQIVHEQTLFVYEKTTQTKICFLCTLLPRSSRSSYGFHGVHELKGVKW